jgi:hypothetical protein
MLRAPEPLSSEEHRELARELRNADTRLRELCSLLVGVYGAESRVAFSFLRATESLERLRREMQVQAVLDCPEISERLYI